MANMEAIVTDIQPTSIKPDINSNTTKQGIHDTVKPVEQSNYVAKGNDTLPTNNSLKTANITKVDTNNKNGSSSKLIGFISVLKYIKNLFLLKIKNLTSQGSKADELKLLVAMARNNHKEVLAGIINSLSTINKESGDIKPFLAAILKNDDIIDNIADLIDNYPEIVSKLEVIMSTNSDLADCIINIISISLQRESIDCFTKGLKLYDSENEVESIITSIVNISFLLAYISKSADPIDADQKNTTTKFSQEFLKKFETAVEPILKLENSDLEFIKSESDREKIKEFIGSVVQLTKYFNDDPNLIDGIHEFCLQNPKTDEILANIFQTQVSYYPDHKIQSSKAKTNFDEHNEIIKTELFKSKFTARNIYTQIKTAPLQVMFVAATALCVAIPILAIFLSPLSVIATILAVVAIEILLLGLNCIFFSLLKFITESNPDYASAMAEYQILRDIEKSKEYLDKKDFENLNVKLLEKEMAKLNSVHNSSYINNKKINNMLSSFTSDNNAQTTDHNIDSFIRDNPCFDKTFNLFYTLFITEEENQKPLAERSQESKDKILEFMSTENGRTFTINFIKRLNEGISPEIFILAMERQLKI